MTVAALVLAAGESRRMGLPKALLAAGGSSFVARQAKALGQAGCRVLVVVGAHAAQIAAAHPELELVVNRRWRQGQLSSVRAGLRRALALKPRAILIHTVDTPRVRAQTFREALEALGGQDAVLPCFRGQPGHPLVLTAAAARRVLRLRRVPHLEAALASLSVARVPVSDPAVVQNVNRPEDYLRLFGRPPRLAPGAAAVRRRGGRKPRAPKRA